MGKSFWHITSTVWVFDIHANIRDIIVVESLLTPSYATLTIVQILRQCMINIY